jgi:hypothetical protein
MEQRMELEATLFPEADADPGELKL